MKQINDGRRNVIVHDNSGLDDLPVVGLSELPPVANTEPFVPVNMDDPRIYVGDVVAGVYSGEVRFVDLIYDKLDQGVLVVPLDTGKHTLMSDQQFSARFFNADEVHIFDDVSNEVPDREVEFDESQVVRPESSRPR